MARKILAYICVAFCLALLVGAVWLNGGGFGISFPFLIPALVLLLLAVLLLHSMRVRL